ncbi:uncharacterized protein LTR77_003014 [Saxophila tyrrhenica]|uniref:Uncharacterized protein n=1 Tax=Saxophila tyrrhenica TaxID=1690608 RepID=A0AAV9PKQ2_9PEZI|nr:hypothetical protein LTR77_003014 [Saxophila tyrrhenica]
MCHDASLPDIDRIERIREYATLFPEDDLGYDDWTADQAVDGENRTVNAIDPDWTWSEQHRLRDMRLFSNYDDLFTRRDFSKRGDRPVQDVSTVGEQGEDKLGLDCRAWMHEWLLMCVSRPGTEADNVIPKQYTKEFRTIMLAHMPARLTLDTWIARQGLETLACLVHGDADRSDEFREWQPSDANGAYQTIYTPDGRATFVTPWMGAGAPGRLIWAPPGGIHENRISALLVRRIGVRHHLRTMELGLIALGRRVARAIAWRLVNKYVHPMTRAVRRPILTRAQVGGAVREILGEEWFELPFDTEDDLYNWDIDEVMTADPRLDLGNVFIDGGEVTVNVDAAGGEVIVDDSDESDEY